MTDRMLRTAARRLRHRSRSVAVSTALVLVALVAAYLGTEAVLAALGRPALLYTPADWWTLLTAPQPWTGAVAAGLAVLGVIAVVLALAPGTLARRELRDDRTVILIDDAVLAGGLSRAAATDAGIAREQVTTSVSRRSAVVTVRPSTGFAIDQNATKDAATAVVDRLAPEPPLRIRAGVAANGVLS